MICSAPDEWWIRDLAAKLDRPHARLLLGNAGLDPLTQDALRKALDCLGGSLLS